MRLFKTCSAVAVALALLIGPVAAENYRLGLITPPPHQWTIHAEEAANEIREATDGRVDILIFPSGQLGNEAQMLQQLQTGAIDFAFLTVAEFANRDPNYGAFLAPYLVENIDQARSLLSGPAAQSLLDGMSNFGLVGLGWSTAGMRTVIMRDDINTVADLAGKKVRTVPNAPELDFWSLLGAAPTPMPLPALYDALANGQVDGAQLDHEGTWNTRYYTHTRTILDSRHAMFPMIAVASARKWQTISEDDQAAIKEVMSQQLDSIVTSYGELDDRFMGELEGTPARVMTVDREWFGEAIDAFYDTWRERAPILVDLEAEAAGLTN
jgi:TRAP-type transport system periplasmic protein